MAVNTTPQPNIEQARDLLSPYLDGEVTPKERRLVEETLASSPELRADLAALRHIITLVTALPPVPAPRPFTLTEADARRVKPAPRRGWFSLPALHPWVGGLAAVAAMLMCVLIVGGLLFRGVGGPGQLPLAAPPQAAYAPAAEKQAKATEAPKAEAQPIQKTVEVAKEAALAPTTTASPAAAPVEPPPEAAKAAEKPVEKQKEVEQEVVKTVEVEKKVAVTATPAAALPAAAAPIPPAAAGAGPAGQTDQATAENIAAAPAKSGITDTTPTTAAMVALPAELTEEPASSQTAGAAANATAITAPTPEQLLDKSQPEATPAPQREIPPAPIATRELGAISPTPLPTASPAGETKSLPTLTPTLPQAEITPPAGSGWMIGVVVGAAVMAGLIGWAVIRWGREKRP